MLDYLENITYAGEKARVLYAFPTYNNEDGHSTITILRTLIFQLCRSDPALTALLVAKCNPTKGNIGKWNEEKWKTVLQELVTIISDVPCFVVLDGLDECDEKKHRRSLLNALLELATNCPSVRLFISSRPEVDLERLLTDNSVKIVLHDNNKADIETFVQTELERHDPWVVAKKGANKEVQKSMNELPGLIAQRSAGELPFLCRVRV